MCKIMCFGINVFDRLLQVFNNYVLNTCMRNCDVR